jgi:hypothetical protein
LADHFDKRWVSAHRCRPNHFDARLARHVRGFYVEVVQNFQMIRNEPERRDNNISRPLFANFS